MPDAPAPDAVPEADTADDTTAAEPEPEVSVEGLRAELDKWKAQSRKHEERAKANAAARKELDEFRKSTMTEQEQAVEAAKAQARAGALVEFGARLVDAEVRAATAGRTVDVDALLEGLDRSRFIDDDGEADIDAIKAWVDRVAPPPADEPPPDPTFPDLGQGRRTRTAPDTVAGDPILNTIRQTLGIR